MAVNAENTFVASPDKVSGGLSFWEPGTTVTRPTGARTPLTGATNLSLIHI